MLYSVVPRPVGAPDTSGVRALPDTPARLAELAEGLEIVALRRLGNREDARDATQETILRLLERLDAGAIASEQEIIPVAWGIARHVITDMLRARGRIHPTEVDVPNNDRGPLDQLVTAEECQAVQAALGQLAAADRSLLHRCFVIGEKIGAIAAALGEPAERLRKRKSRALQRLASLLALRAGEGGHDQRQSPMEEP